MVSYLAIEHPHNISDSYSANGYPFRTRNFGRVVKVAVLCKMEAESIDKSE